MDFWCNSPFCRFYGYGYEELLWSWNMFCDEDDDIAVEMVRYIVGRALDEHMITGACKSKFSVKVLSDCRKFVSELSSFDDYYAPFWRGLCAVESDFAFLSLFYTNVGHAWT